MPRKFKFPDAFLNGGNNLISNELVNIEVRILHYYLPCFKAAESLAYGRVQTVMKSRRDQTPSLQATMWGAAARRRAKEASRVDRNAWTVNHPA